MKNIIRKWLEVPTREEYAGLAYSQKVENEEQANYLNTLTQDVSLLQERITLLEKKLGLKYAHGAKKKAHYKKMKK